MKIFFIFLFFSSLLILNIILSVDQYSSIKSFLGIIRYFILMIAVLYCFNYIKLLFKFFKI